MYSQFENEAIVYNSLLTFKHWQKILFKPTLNVQLDEPTSI